LASLGVSLDGRGSGQCDSMGCEPRHCASRDTLSEPDLAHVCKCVLGRQQTIVKKIVGENKRSWDSKIKYALWADRITKKATIGKSPFELVYDLEARFPIHLRLPTYVLVQDFSTEHDVVQNRVNQIIELYESRRKAYNQN
jgi:hypothetical protein